MNNKRVFSGIQPTGSAHIGNYLGAIKNWAKGQDEKENIFCVVDLHAITIPKNPKELKENISETAKIILASGIDSKKCSLFIQSNRPEHSELAWILNCYTQIGELQRMTQFKEKGQNKKSVSVGLFDYPVLMAADILLYDTNEVPVGEDQKQHIELARDIARRINQKYKDTFVVPEPNIKKETARIMSLDNPRVKMSKSSYSENSFIAIRDEADTIRRKIKKAVTDSGEKIEFKPNEKPALANLLNIYSGFSGEKAEEIASRYKDSGYASFKQDLAEVIIQSLNPIQTKLRDLDKDPGHVASVLAEGSQKVAPIANKTLSRVKKTLGLG